MENGRLDFANIKLFPVNCNWKLIGNKCYHECMAWHGSSPLVHSILLPLLMTPSFLPDNIWLSLICFRTLAPKPKSNLTV